MELKIIYEHEHMRDMVAHVNTDGMQKIMKIILDENNIIVTKVLCNHMVTQGRDNEFGSWCVNCGEKILEVDWRPCRHCVHFNDKANDTPPICTKKLMAVLPDMHVTYYVKDGSCWEQRT